MVGLRNEFGRGVLRGATDFSLLHREWSLLSFEENQLLSPKFCDRYGIDGLIVHLRTDAIYQAALKSGRPFVNVSNRAFKTCVPTVTSDDVAVGKMVADYFVRKRYRCLAFYGQEGKRSFQQRYEGFHAEARGHGAEIQALWAPRADPEAYYTPAHERRLLQWLGSLPTPVAIFAASDRFALNLVDFCYQHGFRIPEDFAIVGVDNDLMKCRMSRIPFSSVELGVEMIGFRAAKMLGSGCPAHSEPIYIPPVRVVERASTEHLFISDPLLREVLGYIRNHLSRPIEVNELASVACVSRRTLERRWRNSFSNSPQQEIRRLKVEAAYNLLLDTRLSCKEVAAAVGLPDGRSLTLLFKSVCGKTPSEIRKQVRTPLQIATS